MKFFYNFLILSFIFLKSATAVKIRKNLQIPPEEIERVRLLSQAQSAHTVHETGHLSNYGHPSNYDHPSEFVDYDNHQGWQEPSHIQQSQNPYNPYFYHNPTAMHYDPMIPPWGDHHTRTQRAKGIVINEPQDGDSSSSTHGDNSDSDYQEESSDSPPRRARATRKSKGKEPAATASYIDHQTSESDEGNSGLQDFGERLHLSANKGAKTPKRRGKKPPTRAENTGHAEQDAARAAFFAQWDQLELGSHMSPTELADQVAVMRVQGIKSQGKGRWSRDRVSTLFENDPAKLYGFQMHGQRLSKYAHKARKRLVKIPEYREMNPEDLHHRSMEMAVEFYNKKDKTTASTSNHDDTNTMTPKQRKNYRDSRLDQIDAFVRNYLENRNMSLASVTLDQLEDRMRNQKMEGMSKKVFADLFFAWLHQRMNISKEDIDILRGYRTAWRDAKRNEARFRSRHNKEESEYNSNGGEI